MPGAWHPRRFVNLDQVPGLRKRASSERLLQPTSDIDYSTLEPIDDDITDELATFYEISSDDYLSITVEGNVPFWLDGESMGRAITLVVGRGSEEISDLALTISGLEPESTYYLYDNGLEGPPIELLSDAAGTVSFVQDVSEPRSLIVLTRPSTIHIQKGVDLDGIGTWDGDTFNLEADISDIISIEAEDFILDGNGHTITNGGQDTFGVVLNYKNNVTIKNVAIQDFYTSIYAFRCSDITIENCKLTSRYGLDFRGCVGGNITRNVLKATGGCSVWFRYVHWNNNYACCTDFTISYNTIEVGGYQYAMLLDRVQRNNISHNVMLSIPYGLKIGGTGTNYLGTNYLEGNTIEASQWSIYFAGSSYNTVVNNNFIGTGSPTHQWDSSFNCFENPSDASSSCPYRPGIQGPNGNYFGERWNSPDDDGNSYVDGSNAYDAGGILDVPSLSSPIGPVVEFDSGTVCAGDVVVEALATQGGPFGSIVADAEYNVDGGHWKSASAADGSFNSATESISVNPGSMSMGTFHMCIRAQNSFGYFGVPQCHDLTAINCDRPPVANAGSDRTVECSSSDGTPVTLDGSDSHDPDNDPLSYEWTLPDGTTMDNRDDPTGTFNLGTMEVELVVNDGTVDSAPSYTEVSVVDTVGPEITLIGDAVVSMECGVDQYAEQGANVFDTCDPNIETVIGGSVDGDTPGSYDVTYDAADAAGNDATQVVRTVSVADTLTPEITLIGDAAIVMECGVDQYAEQGATVSDACDPNIETVI